MAIILVGLLLGLYFLPTFIGYSRSHTQAIAILMLNLFLGWTVIGWVGALVWAFVVPRPQTVIIHQHQPPSA